MLGTVLGVGAFVGVLGLTATGAGQISHQFTVLEDTTVTVEDNGPADNVAPPDANPAIGFPADADAVAGRAGRLTPVPGGVGPVTTALLLRHVVTAAETAAAGYDSR